MLGTKKEFGNEINRIGGKRKKNKNGKFQRWKAFAFIWHIKIEWQKEKKKPNIMYTKQLNPECVFSLFPLVLKKSNNKWIDGKWFKIHDKNEIE